MGKDQASFIRLKLESLDEAHNGVRHAAEKLFHVLGSGRSDFRAETRTRHVDEILVIHPPDVDLRGASGTRQLQRTYQIFCVDAGTLRKIVGCPQWQDAKRRLRAYISSDQGIDHGVQGAVAATGHYPLGTVLDGLPDEPSQILPAPRNINIDVLAGWCVGAAWAAFCWTIFRWLQRRGGI